MGEDENKHQWDVVAQGHDNRFMTYKMKVPGGWIYRHVDRTMSDVGVAICFVPGVEIVVNELVKRED